jgi:hypothetical protein
MGKVLTSALAFRYPVARRVPAQKQFFLMRSEHNLGDSEPRLTDSASSWFFQVELLDLLLSHPISPLDSPVQ